MYPKFSYKLTYKYGDLYYQKISYEEALEKGFYFEEDPSKILKNKHEID